MSDPSDQTMIVDSVSDGVALLESADGRSYSVPVAWLPEGCDEGDVVRIRAGAQGADSVISMGLDPDSTARRRAAVRSKLDALRRRGSP